MKIVSEDKFESATKTLTSNETAALDSGAKLLQTRARGLTPRKSGALRVTIRRATDKNSAAVYSESKYAVKQHQALRFRHMAGQAKYLEIALLANQAAIVKAIAEGLKLNP
jgi:hypothetical protein